jgi:hypothetical protein
MLTFGLITWIFIATFSFCIAIAPLLIWRNTNRTNRLLALLLVQNGVEPSLISKTYYGSGINVDDLGIKESDNQKSYNAEEFKECPKCGEKLPLNATRCICNHVLES